MQYQKTTLAEAISRNDQEFSQSELERRFKEQLSFAQQQDNLQPSDLNDYIVSAKNQLNELIVIAGQLDASLKTVGEFAPFFDMNFLVNEGKTDVSKIDQQYMLTIGRQLINDYQLFKAQSNTIKSRIEQIKVQLNEITSDSPGSISEISDIIMVATGVQTDYVSWGEQFQRIIFSAMSDIVNHLNPLRPEGHRIIL